LAARNWITTSRDGITLLDRDALEVAAGQRWKQQVRRRREFDERQASRSDPE
jgi:hypothetical protein